MKFFLTSVVAVLVTTHSEAFTANLSNQGRFSTKISMASPVISDLISEALKVSEKYGKTSIEARLAWEAVEEVNASDNRYANKSKSAISDARNKKPDISRSSTGDSRWYSIHLCILFSFLCSFFMFLTVWHRWEA